MQNDKSPIIDGLTKEFQEKFWKELKEIFVDSVSEAKSKEHLHKSQRQAIIKFIGKKMEIRYSFKFGDTFLC